MVGKRVRVKWLYQSCHDYPTYSNSFTHIYPKQQNTNRSCPKTLQQYIIIDSKHLTIIPNTLPEEIATSLLYTSLTIMDAVQELSNNSLNTKDWIVVIDAGGSLRHISIQITSQVKGLRVITVDTEASKRYLLNLKQQLSLTI